MPAPCHRSAQFLPSTASPVAARSTCQESIARMSSSPRYNHVLEGERVRRRGSLLKRMSTKFLKRKAQQTDGDSSPRTPMSPGSEAGSPRPAMETSDPPLHKWRDSIRRDMVYQTQPKKKSFCGCSRGDATPPGEPETIIVGVRIPEGAEPGDLIRFDARGLGAVARLTFTLDGSERIVERASTVYSSD